MSDDLISRKSVINLLYELLEISEYDGDKILYTKDSIENLPITYDVDKVIEKLEHIANHYECEEQGREDVYMVDLEPAIEVVKGGGIDE